MTGQPLTPEREHVVWTLTPEGREWLGSIEPPRETTGNGGI